jgi:negative regulator of sigma-B (phosphoserine phosphatase)
MAEVVMKCVTWAVDTLMLPGHLSCGDQYLVTGTPEGVLVAVIDGLGHGEEAATAALTAIAVLEQNPTMNVVALMQHCHEHLRSTRGVVMTLASFNCHDGLFTWIGVGNVSGIFLANNGSSSRETLLLRGGVVGHQLPRLQAAIHPLKPGDTLILATDGVHRTFEDSLPTRGTPRELAERILLHHSTGIDEAMVLVARYKGEDRS